MARASSAQHVATWHVAPGAPQYFDYAEHTKFVVVESPYPGNETFRVLTDWRR